MDRIMLFLIISLFLFAVEVVSFAFGHPLCSSHDSLALLQFSNSLNVGIFIDEHCESSYPKTPSWNTSTSMDCCRWDGVTCDVYTGHVIGLDLSCCRLEGTIHPNSSLFQLRHLQTLDLSHNYFGNSPFPQGIGQLASLTHLNLSYCFLQGSIPSDISHLSNLVSLDLSYYDGIDDQFSREGFNMLLRNLTKLEVLSLSYVYIASSISMNISSSLRYLDLTSTNLHRDLPKNIFLLPNLETLILSNNMDLTVSLPKFNWSSSSHSLRELDLSLTNISGGLPNSFGTSLKALKILRLSMCNYAGPFPEFIRNLSQITQLDLSDNHLEGEIPDDVFSNLKRLTSLSLQNNAFTGQFPSSLVNLTKLQVLNLGSNSLSGPLPEFKTNSIVSCTFLKVLDLANNNIRDTFPAWLEMLPELEILILKSNRFYGPIGGFQTKSPFSSLRIFDLSGNSFNGSLPTKLLKGFKAMMNMDAHKSGLEYYFDENVIFHSDQDRVSVMSWYAESMILVIKNQETKFNKVLKIFSTIDLSRNKFEGEIPKIIGNLNSLLLLNLSHNHLTGQIPVETRNMRTLEALDLSFNRLTGKIPEELTSLTFLAVLNLSHNHFVGRIPQSNQFNTFPNDSYFGNSELCGFPLSNECGQHKSAPEPAWLDEQEEDESSLFSEMTWQSVLIGYCCGLAFGFTILYLIYLFERPRWFIDFLETITHEMIYRANRGSKRPRKFHKTRRSEIEVNKG